MAVSSPATLARKRRVARALRRPSSWGAASRARRAGGFDRPTDARPPERGGCMVSDRSADAESAWLSPLVQSRLRPIGRLCDSELAARRERECDSGSAVNVGSQSQFNGTSAGPDRIACAGLVLAQPAAACKQRWDGDHAAGRLGVERAVTSTGRARIARLSGCAKCNDVESVLEVDASVGVLAEAQQARSCS